MRATIKDVAKLAGVSPSTVTRVIQNSSSISQKTKDKVRQAIEDNPDAVAVFVNNPTYYGICSDIKTIVELVHARGMKVLAEGIETEAQLERLKAIGCRRGQGYLFSRPLPEDEFVRWGKANAALAGD